MASSLCWQLLDSLHLQQGKMTLIQVLNTPENGLNAVSHELALTLWQRLWHEWKLINQDCQCSARREEIDGVNVVKSHQWAERFVLVVEERLACLFLVCYHLLYKAAPILHWQVGLPKCCDLDWVLLVPLQVPQSRPYLPEKLWRLCSLCWLCLTAVKEAYILVKFIWISVR